MSLKYIRDTYGVPAFIGTRVEFQPNRPGNPPWQGTIVGASSAYLRIRRDGDVKTYPGYFHPEWNLTYLLPEAKENKNERSH